MIRWFLALVCLLGAAPLRAEDKLIESYTARLSVQDHFSSTGTRLNTAAAVIRQDRANYHKFGKADPEDGGDAYFAGAAAREALERLLERGRSTRGVLNAIVNGTPLVSVSIYRSEGGAFYVTVVLLD